MLGFCGVESSGIVVPEIIESIGVVLDATCGGSVSSVGIGSEYNIMVVSVVEAGIVCVCWVGLNSVSDVVVECGLIETTCWILPFEAVDTIPTGKHDMISKQNALDIPAYDENWWNYPKDEDDERKLFIANKRNMNTKQNPVKYGC